MEIYIVRHGETLWNKEKRWQGRTDIELSDYGRELARITGEGLADTHFDIIYSSPLRRAYETATLIRGDRAIEIVQCDILKELSFGSYEGKLYADLVQDDSLTFKHFFKRPELYIAPPDGETLEALCERASEFMSTVVEPLEKEKHPERIMIVAHGAMNKAIMTHIKKHEIKDFWSGKLQKNCNIIIVDYTDGKYTIIDESKLFYDA